MDVKKELEAKSWRFAKTMPHNPHFYSLKEEWQNPASFSEAVQYIRENGIPEMFGGREYTVFYHNGFKYWTMGDPLEYTYLKRASISAISSMLASSRSRHARDQCLQKFRISGCVVAFTA